MRDCTELAVASVPYPTSAASSCAVTTAKNPGHHGHLAETLDTKEHIGRVM
jgi:hypothetical protein